MSEAKLTLIKWLDPGTASPESLVEPFKKLSGLLLTLTQSYLTPVLVIIPFSVSAYDNFISHY